MAAILKDILVNIYLVLIAVVFIVGSFRKKYFDSKMLIVYYLMVFTVVGEIASFTLLYTIDTKVPAFHFTSVISLSILASYFLKSTSSKTSNRQLLAVYLLIILIGLINLRFQNLHQLCSNTMILRAFVVILMALFSLYKIFIDDNFIDPTSDAHFWISVVFLILYGGTYFFWSYVKILSANGKGPYQDIVICVQAVINLISYGSIGCIFLLHPKKFPGLK